MTQLTHLARTHAALLAAALALGGCTAEHDARAICDEDIEVGARGTRWSVGGHSLAVIGWGLEGLRAIAPYAEHEARADPAQGIKYRATILASAMHHDGAWVLPDRILRLLDASLRASDQDLRGMALVALEQLSDPRCVASAAQYLERSLLAGQPREALDALGALGRIGARNPALMHAEGREQERENAVGPWGEIMYGTLSVSADEDASELHAVSDEFRRWLDARPATLPTQALWDE